MPRNCEVCKLPRFIKIGAEERLSRGEPLEQIARDCRVTTFSLAHHRREGHIKNLPIPVTGTPDQYHQDLDFVHHELQNLLADFTAINPKTERPYSAHDAVLCLKEMAKVIEAKAKLAGAYNNPNDPALDPRVKRLMQLLAEFAVKHSDLKDEVLLLLDTAQFGEEGTGT